jgi:putative ABC transport system ATP-binding protein
MNEMIKIQKLGKLYPGAAKNMAGTKALDNIDLSIEKGEFVGIMGPSGSGKTTLLNLMSGIDTPSQGNVFINGADITKMKRDELSLFRRQNIGYIFQDFNLLDSLTAKENIALPLILDKVTPKEIEERVTKLINFFGIQEIAQKAPFQISGGQKQRVAAARALVVNPAVCFADEPTGNLDSKSAANVMGMMEQMNEEANATILMVTHDAFAASYCKKIIFIKDGKVTLQLNRTGSRRDFFDKILETLSYLEA